MDFYHHPSHLQSCVSSDLWRRHFLVLVPLFAWLLAGVCVLLAADLLLFASPLAGV